MNLFHITTPKAWNRIKKRGIDPQKSRTQRKVVWLCTADAVPKWIDHIARHQESKAIVLLRVRVPKHALRTPPFGITAAFLYPLLIPPTSITWEATLHL